VKEQKIDLRSEILLLPVISVYGTGLQIKKNMTKDIQKFEHVSQDVEPASPSPLPAVPLGFVRGGGGHQP
jgi:hypothetical protein